MVVEFVFEKWLSRKWRTWMISWHKFCIFEWTLISSYVVTIRRWKIVQFKAWTPSSFLLHLQNGSENLKIHSDVPQNRRSQWMIMSNETFLRVDMLAGRKVIKFFWRLLDRFYRSLHLGWLTEHQMPIYDRLYRNWNNILAIMLPSIYNCHVYSIISRCSHDIFRLMSLLIIRRFNVSKLWKAFYFSTQMTIEWLYLVFGSNFSIFL